MDTLIGRDVTPLRSKDGTCLLKVKGRYRWTSDSVPSFPLSPHSGPFLGEESSYRSNKAPTKVVGSYSNLGGIRTSSNVTKSPVHGGQGSEWTQTYGRPTLNRGRPEASSRVASCRTVDCAPLLSPGTNV